MEKQKDEPVLFYLKLTLEDPLNGRHSLEIYFTKIALLKSLKRNPVVSDDLNQPQDVEKVFRLDKTNAKEIVIKILESLGDSFSEQQCEEFIKYFVRIGFDAFKTNYHRILFNPKSKLNVQYVNEGYCTIIMCDHIDSFFSKDIRKEFLNNLVRYGIHIGNTSRNLFKILPKCN